MRSCTKTGKYEVMTTLNQVPDPRASQLLISEKAVFCKNEEHFEHKENFCQEWQEGRGEQWWKLYGNFDGTRGSSLWITLIPRYSAVISLEIFLSEKIEFSSHLLLVFVQCASQQSALLENPSI